MIESVPLTTTQKTVMVQQGNSLKNRMKRGNSDVPLFQYKVTVLQSLPLSNIKKKLFYRSNPYKNQSGCSPPSSHVLSFLSKAKHLGKIKLQMSFTLFVNSLKKCFKETKT